MALIGICAVWGLTFVVVKDAIKLLPVMTFLAYRFVSATVVVALAFRRDLRSLTTAGLGAGLVMGIFLTGGYVLQTVGLSRTSASNAGFITGLFVVLTPLFASIVLKQRVGLVTWVAAGVSTVGLLLLSLSGDAGDPIGDLLVLLCACSFALHILATDRGVARHSLGALLTVQLAVCGVFSFGVAAVAGDLEIPSSGVVWSALAITSLVATALAYFVQSLAQRRASPARTALILTSEPVFAGLFAYLLASETQSPVGWIGAGLIVAAIVAVEAFPYLLPPPNAVDG